MECIHRPYSLSHKLRCSLFYGLIDNDNGFSMSQDNFAVLST